jgi:hypothetical protein
MERRMNTTGSMSCGSETTLYGHLIAAAQPGLCGPGIAARLSTLGADCLMLGGV